MTAPRHTTASETFPIPEIIPIFPLPNVVLFPDTYLPLHIFEHRYRDMVADVGKDNTYIGMVLLQEGWERDYEGSPPVCTPGCVGRVSTIRHLRDGRSNLILQGLARFTIDEEMCDASYRKARITMPSRQPFHAIADETARATVTELAVRYLRARKARDLCALITNTSISDTVLVNSLSSCLDFTPLEKQFLLESESLTQQTRRLIDLLRFQLSDVLSPSGEQ